tara:strand:+ start:1784 stop:2557 length:774 start_codon:yes stop_codon:yes gene_type:complete
MAENYQLSCCSTNEMLQINNLPAVFEFTGKIQNNNHPDNFKEVVLTAIKDINSNVVTGCYKLVEWDCPEEYEKIPWEDFFVLTECVGTCIECLPKPEPVKFITNHKTIYPEFKVNNVDADKAESIFCKFGSAIYEEVLELRYGIKHCCPTDLMHSRIAFEILKMDITENKLDCCPDPVPTPPKCKIYIITIPAAATGFLYFNDCLNQQTEVSFDVSKTEYQTSICGIEGQTSSEIFIKTNLGEILNITFIESEQACT